MDGNLLVGHPVTQPVRRPLCLFFYEKKGIGTLVFHFSSEKLFRLIPKSKKTRIFSALAYFFRFSGGLFRRFRSFEFLEVGQILEAAQSEDFQKGFRRSVKPWTPQFFRPSDDPDQVTVQKLPDQIAAMDSSDSLDFRAHDRLSISDHGQGFHGRRAQANRFRNFLEPNEPRSELRSGSKLEPAGNLNDSKGRLL